MKIELILFIICMTLACSLVLGMVIYPSILYLSYKKQLFDVPDARKVHHSMVPRIGGVAFMPAILISFCLGMAMRYLLATTTFSQWRHTSMVEYLLFIVGTSIVYFIGVYDDIVGVKYTNKFAAQVFAGCLLSVSGLWINNLGGLFGIYEIHAWLGMPLTVLLVVYITNAINLIDGIDGLASGIVSISLIALAVLCICTRQMTHGMLAVACLGVLLVFFYYNVFSDKKLFMGDTGSLTLGYFLCFILLHFCQQRPWWNPMGWNLHVVAFSTLVIPLFDVVRVFVVRVRAHHNPFLPDQNHIHHKMMRAGLSQRGAMIVILLLALFFMGIDSALAFLINDTFIVAIDIVLWIAVNWVIDWQIRRHGQPVITNVE
jgi:UDP-GlcNAc:undecaprenyl-phosphate GlcNAc-1-phosphate transferase